VVEFFDLPSIKKNKLLESTISSFHDLYTKNENEFQILINAAMSRSMAVAIVAAIFAASLKLAWGIIPAYLSERFPTKTRSVGVGFGYSAGALVGGAGITPLVAMFHEIPAISAIEGPKELWLSASGVLTIGAMITFLSLWLSHETKDIDLRTGEICPVTGSEVTPEA